MATRTVLTYKDDEALPADGRRYEIHDGEFSVTLAPSPSHQQLSGNLFFLLHRHVESRGLGRVLYVSIDCILSETTIVQPDLVYLAVDRLTAISGRGIEGPPTLVIEIVSPSTSQIDRGTKHQLYSRHGAPCYWIVDPDARTIEGFSAGAGSVRSHGTARHGWRERSRSRWRLSPSSSWIRRASGRSPRLGAPAPSPPHGGSLTLRRPEHRRRCGASPPTRAAGGCTRSTWSRSVDSL